MLPELYL